MTLGRLAFTMGALVVLSTPELAAQPQPGRADSVRARELFERAVQLMENQDWSAALVQLEESFRLRPTQVALFNMGLCYKGLLRYGAAIAAFERLVTQFGDQGSEARVELARQELQSLRSLFGTVLVRVDVTGAEILMDGAVQGTTPLAEPLAIAAGNHTIQARRDGYSPAEQEVAIIAGTHSSVELVLRPIEPPREAVVQHPSPDGPPQEPVPPARPRRHPHRAATEVTTGLRPVWFWSTVALSGAGAITTAILGGLVVAGDADYRASRPRLASDRDAGRQLALFTDVALGVSLAAAVGAVLLYGPTDFGGRPDVDGGGALRARLSPALSARPGHWSIGLSGAL